jgi:hypothetical protein
MYVLNTNQDLNIAMHEMLRDTATKTVNVKMLNPIQRDLKHLNQYSRASLFAGVMLLKNPINANIAK